MSTVENKSMHSLRAGIELSPTAPQCLSSGDRWWRGWPECGMPHSWCLQNALRNGMDRKHYKTQSTLLF